MNGYHEFNFSKNMHDSVLLEFAQKYGKVKGYLLAQEFGLNSSSNGIIVYDKITNASFRNIDMTDVLLCRTDAPLGSGYLMPRGKDLTIDCINSFLEELKQIHPESILLCLKHPSIELFGKYTPRYQTNGAISVILNVGENITIEYVGKGFDAGDLSRGKAVHTSIIIPWGDLTMPPSELYKLAKRGVYFFNEVSLEQYLMSREERIDELILRLGEKEKYDIQKSIPMCKPSFSGDLFVKSFSTINRLMLSGFEILGNRFGLLVNVYGTKLYVFEIWRMERSLPCL